MKVKIKKIYSCKIDVLVDDYPLMQVEKQGVYRYYLHDPLFSPNCFCVDPEDRIAEEQ